VSESPRVRFEAWAGVAVTLLVGGFASPGLSTTIACIVALVSFFLYAIHPYVAGWRWPPRLGVYILTAVGAFAAFSSPLRKQLADVPPEPLISVECVAQMEAPSADEAGYLVLLSHLPPGTQVDWSLRRYPGHGWASLPYDAGLGMPHMNACTVTNYSVGRISPRVRLRWPSERRISR
jgi:hypothetical protein